jgi:hypothetical protein
MARTATLALVPVALLVLLVVAAGTRRIAWLPRPLSLWWLGLVAAGVALPGLLATQGLYLPSPQELAADPGRLPVLLAGGALVLLLGIVDSRAPLAVAAALAPFALARVAVVTAWVGPLPWVVRLAGPLLAVCGCLVAGGLLSARRLAQA